MLPLITSIRNFIAHYKPTQPVTVKPENRPMMIQREKIPIQTKEAAPITKVVHVKAISDIARVSGVAWQCVDQIDESDDGVIYKFKLRKEFDFITKESLDIEIIYQKKMKEIFPAVEVVNYDILLLLDPNTDHATKIDYMLKRMMLSPTRINEDKRHPFNVSFPNPAHSLAYTEKLKPLAEKMLENFELLNRLGFKVHFETNPGMLPFLFDHRGVYVSLPDRETLLFRWDQERQRNPNLPEISLEPSEGIADDLTFITNFFDRGITISDDKEFVHDLLSHVLPYLLMILEGITQSRNVVEDYKALKIEMRTFIDNCLNAERLIDEGKIDVPDDVKAKLLQNREQLHTIFGAWVDEVSASSEATRHLDVVHTDPTFNIMSILLVSNHWEKYFKKRYNDKEFKLRPLIEFLRTLNTLGAEKAA